MARRRTPAHRPRTRRRRTGSPLLVGVGLAATTALALWGLWASRATDAQAPLSTARTVRSLRTDVLRTIPHDTTAYTQGLVWHDGYLYESTGQYGESRLRRIDPRTGRVEQEIPIAAAFFGEGLALVGDELYLLTYQAQRGMVFDRETFAPIRTFRYRGEGWGLCHDGRRLIMSNGSADLTFRDTDSFDPIGTVQVTLRGWPLNRLNELECVADRVYANIYQDDSIVVIDPESGRVTHQIDATGLLTPEEARRADVLNGIAYDPVSRHFYLTGKDWPKLFEVQFVE